jgi:hypothetical protein
MVIPDYPIAVLLQYSIDLGTAGIDDGDLLVVTE